jgi:hypothetical protein
MHPVCTLYAPCIENKSEIGNMAERALEENRDTTPLRPLVPHEVAPQGDHAQYMITVVGEHQEFPISRFMAHRRIIEYIVYQREVGRLAGHPHWHAYVEFVRPVPATWVRTTFFPPDIVDDVDLQSVRNRYAARKYVMKPHTRIPGTLHEWGAFPRHDSSLANVEAFPPPPPRANLAKAMATAAVASAATGSTLGEIPVSNTKATEVKEEQKVTQGPSRTEKHAEAQRRYREKKRSAAPLGGQKEEEGSGGENTKKPRVEENCAASPQHQRQRMNQRHPDGGRHVQCNLGWKLVRRALGAAVGGWLGCCRARCLGRRRRGRAWAENALSLPR